MRTFSSSLPLIHLYTLSGPTHTQAPLPCLPSTLLLQHLSTMPVPPATIHPHSHVSRLASRLFSPLLLLLDGTHQHAAFVFLCCHSVQVAALNSAVRCSSLAIILNDTKGAPAQSFVSGNRSEWSVFSSVCVYVCVCMSVWVSHYESLYLSVVLQSHLFHWYKKRLHHTKHTHT